MSTFPSSVEPVAASEIEVARWLSEQEGRDVTVLEVRRIEFQALRKLRHALQQLGLTPENLLPDR